MDASPTLVCAILVTVFLLTAIYRTIQPRQTFLLQIHYGYFDEDVEEMMRVQRQHDLREFELNAKRTAQQPEPAANNKHSNSKYHYPKTASDSLTSMDMTPDEDCPDDLKAVIIVHSAGPHFHRRSILRVVARSSPEKVKIVFLIGQSLKANLRINLEMENRLFGDTVVGDFIDTYHNLTLKAVMGYRWLNQSCARTPIVIKLDDDVILDLPRFFNFWGDPARRSRQIACFLIKWGRVMRTGKWKVEREVISEDHYKFPFCMGPVVVISGDLIHEMYNKAKEIGFFWIDDVFMYGMVPYAIGGIEHLHMKFEVTMKYEKFLDCRSKHGDKCSYWGVLANGIQMMLDGYKTVGVDVLKANSSLERKFASESTFDDKIWLYGPNGTYKLF